MNAGGRPMPVTLLAIVYMAMGAIGIVYHYPGFRSQQKWHQEDVWIELTEAAALIGGVFLWRGRNWARWLAVAWMAFHVVLSMFNTLREVIIHAILCAVIAWILFGPPGARYFRR